MKYSFLILFFFILHCSLIEKTKKTVLQGENGNLELTISSNVDTISKNEIENLRIYVTLKNNFPFTIQSSKFVNSIECEIFRNDVYFHSIDRIGGGELEYLAPLFVEFFAPDSSVTAMLYLNIVDICNKKGLPLKGKYKFQGHYSNQIINDNEKTPIWVGSIKSNKKDVVIN